MGVTNDTLILVGTDEYVTVSKLLRKPFKTPDSRVCVEGFFFSGVKQIIQIETITGMTIKCSPDHRLVLQRNKNTSLVKYHPASEIREGDFIAIHTDRNVDLCEEVIAVRELAYNAVFSCNFDSIVSLYISNGFLSI